MPARNSRASETGCLRAVSHRRHVSSGGSARMADNVPENSPGHRAYLFGWATQSDRQPIDDDRSRRPRRPIRRKNGPRPLCDIPAAGFDGNILRRIRLSPPAASGDQLADEVSENREVLSPCTYAGVPGAGSAGPRPWRSRLMTLTSGRKHSTRVKLWRAGARDTGAECRTLRCVIAQRHCSKPGCSAVAVAYTLTRLS